MADILFEILDWEYATLVYAIMWYVFFRGISIYAEGNIYLTKRMRWFFFPFSRRQTIFSELIIVILFSYMELFLFFLTRLPCVTEYIGDNYEYYNTAGLFFLFMSGAFILFLAAFDIPSSMPLSPVAEKICFALALLAAVVVFVVCLAVIVFNISSLIQAHKLC